MFHVKHNKKVGEIMGTDGLGLFYNDIYPGYKPGTETSTNVNPQADDQDALNEDTKVAEKADVNNASKKNVLLAFGVLVALIIFLGGAK